MGAATSWARELGFCALAAAASGRTLGAAEPPAAAPRTIVILMIGDGLGANLLDAASMYKAGRLEALALQQLPVGAKLRTDSLDGVTDSAAAATAMACGVLTRNERVGMDGADAPCRTVVDTARERGIAFGLVTTDVLYGATPGAFTAHALSRELVDSIAEQQVQNGADVMFGGGGELYLDPRNRGGMPTSLGHVIQRDYTLVRNRVELEAALASHRPRLWGLFADHWLPWALERAPRALEPTLVEMARAALEVLDRDAQGFLLLIESGMIDKAAHQNHLPRAIYEVLAFDATVVAVMDWAANHPDSLLIVTSDHDTGDPRLVEAKGVRKMPRVLWTSKDHTGAPVELYAQGPGSELFNEGAPDHRWVHAVIEARLRGESPRAPARRPGTK